MITPHKILEIKNRKRDNQKVISYSQLSLFLQCPHLWKIQYIDKIKLSSMSIHLTFGTTFHEIIQKYVETIFSASLKEANELDIETLLSEGMFKNYIKNLEENNKVHFSTPKELTEFTKDGIQILDWIKRHIVDYINKKNQYLIGSEIPIHYHLQSNLYFTGYIDQIIGYKNSNNIKIWDYKTSTRGWNDYKKKDKLTSLQLVLYKYFILKELELDIKEYEKFVDVEYFIVKRKLIDDSEFMQKRVQIFKPSNGIVSLNRAKNYLDLFLKKAFKENSSEYKLDETFPAISGLNNNNCRFCPLLDNEELCPKKLRIKEPII